MKSKEEILNFFDNEAALGFCTNEYALRLKWYFATYYNEYSQQSQPSGMRWVRASERPFSVELLWNDEFHPGESAISWMGKDEYDKFDKEYKAKEDAVLFTNTRVEYDSCDCGGEYGCSHGSWPITIHFGNNPESCKGDFEDETTLVLYGTKNAVTVHDYTKITIGQFVEICDIVGIVLHIKPEWLSESSPAGAAEGASEGMAEALAKFFAKECKVGDPLLPIIDSIYDDWKLVYDKLRIETSFSEAAIQANKFVIEKYASLSPGVEDNQTKKQ